MNDSSHKQSDIYDEQKQPLATLFQFTWPSTWTIMEDMSPRMRMGPGSGLGWGIHEKEFWGFRLWI